MFLQQTISLTLITLRLPKKEGEELIEGPEINERLLLFSFRTYGESSFQSCGITQRNAALEVAQTDTPALRGGRRRKRSTGDFSQLKI